MSRIAWVVCLAQNAERVGTGSSQATCNVLRFDNHNHCSGNCSGSQDWSVGYSKNTCASSQYVKGVSKYANPVLSNGEISAMLCCNWN